MIKTMFSDKSKTADAKWKIKIFKQGKKYIANFMIWFKTLAIKAETNNLYAIFLLKKNIWTDIIKTILEYPPMVVPETLKEWKVAIILIEQGYKFIESQQDYKTRTRITYGKRSIPMNIGKARKNFNKDRKLRCFNYNTYEYMAKKY